MRSKDKISSIRTELKGMTEGKIGLTRVFILVVGFYESVVWTQKCTTCAQIVFLFATFLVWVLTKIFFMKFKVAESAETRFSNRKLYLPKYFWKFYIKPTSVC